MVAAFFSRFSLRVAAAFFTPSICALLFPLRTLMPSFSSVCGDFFKAMRQAVAFWLTLNEAPPKNDVK